MGEEQRFLAHARLQYFLAEIELKNSRKRHSILY